MKTALRLVPEEPVEATPVLKWVGGKRWFVKEFGRDFFDHVLFQGGTYYEPFLGGASMALYFGFGNMVLADIEEELITMYRAVRDQPQELIVMLQMLENCGKDKETYYAVREANPLSGIEIAARLIYLNKLGFNGLYRKNKSGEFNVAYGGNAKRRLPYEEIIEASKALSRSRIEHASYFEIIEQAGKGDTVYADPPYHGTFGGYSSERFQESDQEMLAESLYSAKKRGATFFAHNADTDKVRYWYEGWTQIIPMNETRKVNADKNGRGHVPCVLIVGE